mmetsp:Transcript_11464/g.24556  ORF Transcript_11464/g.24556 Transcript_11464/m.24556 type:complete len:322 (-) Transcript_11464:685-1650(-)
MRDRLAGFFRGVVGVEDVVLVEVDLVLQLVEGAVEGDDGDDLEGVHVPLVAARRMEALLHIAVWQLVPAIKVEHAAKLRALSAPLCEAGVLLALEVLHDVVGCVGHGHAEGSQVDGRHKAVLVEVVVWLKGRKWRLLEAQLLRSRREPPHVRRKLVVRVEKRVDDRGVDGEDHLVEHHVLGHDWCTWVECHEVVIMHTRGARCGDESADRALWRRRPLEAKCDREEELGRAGGADIVQVAEDVHRLEKLHPVACRELAEEAIGPALAVLALPVSVGVELDSDNALLVWCSPKVVAQDHRLAYRVCLRGAHVHVVNVDRRNA